MPTVYVQQVHQLINACEAFCTGTLPFLDFKAEVWTGAMAIEACDELDFRRFLQCAEGKLDELQFLSHDLQRDATLIALEVAEICREQLP